MDLKFNANSRRELMNYFGGKDSINEESQLLQQQFAQKQLINFVIIFFGATSFIVGLAEVFVGSLFGIVFLVIGLALLIFAIVRFGKIRKEKDKIENNRVKKEKLKKLLESKIDKLFKTAIAEDNFENFAIEKLGVNSNDVRIISPIFIAGYYYDDIGNCSTEYVLGNDGKYCSDSYEYTIILFSETQLFILSYRYNVTANVSDISMDEYFYQDIVSISTSSEKVVKKQDAYGNPIVTFNVENLVMTTKGGTTAKCSVLATDSSTQQSITAMKHLLREKKHNN